MLEITKTKMASAYIATFMILYASASFFCKNLLSETYNVLIMIFALFLLALAYKRLWMSKKTLIMCIVFVLMGTCSSLFAGDELLNIVYPAIAFFIALVYVSIVDWSLFKKVYVNIMTFISGFSIAVYFLYLIAPSIIQSFPIIVNKVGTRSYNLFFSILTPSSFLRDEGFFWESGAFQTFIIIAIVILIYSREYEPRVRACKLVTLYIALILTFSTTGYIAGIITVILLLLERTDGKPGKITIALFVILALGIGLIMSLPYLPETVGGVSVGINKLNMFMGGVSTSGNVTSASVRYDSVYYPLKEFTKHPILGYGYKSLDIVKSQMLHGMVTCTPANYLVMYGIFYSVLVFSCLGSLCRNIASRKVEIILVFVSIFIAIISEHYVNYVIIDIFILYGASTLFKKSE